MESHFIENFIIFSAFFLTLTAALQSFCKKYPLPYTVSVLIAGLVTQLITHTLHIDPHISLTPQTTFFILLPLLLFESAMHINFHEFKIQFKTITFLATFGLLVSIFTIGFALNYILGLPLIIALLFGALISATDPIAVIALFKTLGAPRRLGLVADGESMFNDATGVMAFRILSTFALAGVGIEAGKILQGAGQFVYIFAGSIVVGVILGYLTSKIIAKIESDRFVETTLTVGLALFSFVFAEHFLHISGVITTVMAGITLGNLGRTKISRDVENFITELWEYIAFISVSLVFFFAAYNLNLEIFAREPGTLILVIAIVLVARAVSVYLSALISNKLPLFKNEPNLPASWQHILNWGGLRGVIPLVLVYSLPEDFIYREEFLAFTLSTLLFTLIINGLTIRPLLIKLNLHIKRKDEQIREIEQQIFAIVDKRNQLAFLSHKEYSAKTINSIKTQLTKKETQLKNKLEQTISPSDFENSLALELLSIEKEKLAQLFAQNQIKENTFYQFDTEIDLQYDALEYPEIYFGRGYEPGGKVDAKKSYRLRLMQARRLVTKYPFVASLLNVSQSGLILERYELLKARVATSEFALDHLNQLKYIFQKPSLVVVIEKFIAARQKMITKNLKEMRQIEINNRQAVENYKKTIISTLISKEVAPAHS